MKIMICLDEQGGMTFLGKRQSRDAAVCRDMVREAEGGRLLVSEYSLPLFGEGEATAVSNPLGESLAEDSCFIEREDIIPYIENADSLIIYRWNRLYPSDRRLDILPENYGLKLKRSTDIVGKSHEKITKEVYER